MSKIIRLPSFEKGNIQRPDPGYPQRAVLHSSFRNLFIHSKRTPFMENMLPTIDLRDYFAEKRKTTKIFAHFCSYTPEEILHAAGILPVRLFGTKTTEKADTHLQSYCCAYAKRVLEQGLTNAYHGSVFVHSCDTMQRLSDIWAQTICEKFHDTVIFPVRMDKGLNYLILELERFKKNLEEYAGDISQADLKESIKIYNKNRKLLQNLYEKRKKGHIPAETVDHIMRASMTMEKEEHTKLLEQYLQEVELGESLSPRLLLGGSVITDPELLSVIEECSSVKFDDFCHGSRYYEPAQELSLAGMARRYQHMWCPCRASSTHRAEYLIEKCKEYSIDGVVFLLQKFCEPHFFDVVHTRNKLKDAGYPSLVLELQDQPVEQLRTRIQAFCEMVRG